MNQIFLFLLKSILRYTPKRIVLPTLFLFLLTFFSLAAEAQTRYYINQAVSATGDGKSWATAFKTLQEGIEAASSSVADELWVAQGTYVPNTDYYGNRYDPPSSSRTMTFFLEKPIHINGGFLGSETSLTQRNWEANETILSGNILDPADSTDNIYHVMLIMGTQDGRLENVVVDGFTIRDGYANFMEGYLVNGIAVYNYEGGGIYNILASPELRNLKIIKNVGFAGGGIHNHNSSPKIENCQILQNYSGASGAGISNHKGSLLVNNTLIANNRVNNEGGGGISSNITEVIIKNSVIRDNHAHQGGGIYSSGGTAELENVTIEGNTALDGGGIYNYLDVELRLKNTAVVNNRATFGGGMRSFRATVLRIDSSRFSNNTAEQFGGGMHLDGDSILLNESHIDSNKAVKYDAGGLFASNVYIHFKGGTAKGNTAKVYAGGMYFRYDSYGIFDDVEISKNVATNDGGGILMVGSSYPEHQMQFSNVRFEDNKASSGGGIYLNNTYTTFENVSFKRNIGTTDAGGGMLISGGTPQFNNCIFEQNKAYIGGGFYSQSGAGVVMKNISFTENEATAEGGGFFCSDNGGSLNAIHVRGNKAVDGGGAYLRGGGNFTNMLFSGNNASGKGGGIYVQYAAPFLTNLTIAGNNAVGGGGGIYANASANLNIRNTVIYGNGTGLGFVNGLPKIFYSLIEGRNTVTNGNIAGTTDPLFVHPEPFTNAPNTVGNYFLQSTSPLLEKGNNTFFAAGSTPDLSAIATDLLGNTRFYNTTVDIGAYEYQPGVVVPLKLVSFEAVAQNRSVNIFWEAEDEINVSHFEIERSTDGISFRTVGIERAMSRRNYHFNDQQPPFGNLYYRLKIVDKDGQTDYSIVKLVKFMSSHQSVVFAYPTPSTSVIYVTDRGKSLIQGSFSVLSSTGQQVMHTQTNPINIQSLAPGVYYV